MVSVSACLLCGMIFAKGGRVSSDVLCEQDRSGNDRKSGAGEVGSNLSRKCVDDTRKNSDQSEVSEKKYAETSWFYDAHSAVDDLFMVKKVVFSCARHSAAQYPGERDGVKA